MKRKPFLLLLLALVVIGGIAGWTYINKPPAKVEDEKGIAVTAEALTDLYSKDEAEANKKYINQALEVTGTIAEISKNQDGKLVILLQADDPMSGVQCTMREHLELAVGSQVKLKGFCTGYTMVVLLGDCIVL